MITTSTSLAITAETHSADSHPVQEGRSRAGPGPVQCGVLQRARGQAATRAWPSGYSVRPATAPLIARRSSIAQYASAASSEDLGHMQCHRQHQ